MDTEIRLARAQDARAVRTIYAPIVAETVISFELDVPSVEEMAQRITTTLPRYPWLVAARDGEVVGYAYATRHRERQAYGWAVDVSVYLGGEARGRGLGRALYTRLLELLALQGYRRAYAGIVLPNPASVGLHEAVGFVPVGVFDRVGWKFGAWHDVGWWQRDISTPDGAPTSPRPLDTLDALEREEVGRAK